MMSVRTALAVLLILSACEAAELPNIIAFLGDDMGWSNAGWHNNNTQTPFMDNLIRNEGIELDRHYVFFYCSPTRTSLMSGRLPLHVTEVNGHACSLHGPAPLEMTFLPEKLKSVGYKTHQIGKWHVGGAASWAAIPISRGFDSSFGYLNGAEDHYINTNHACASCGQAVDLWRSDRPAYGENGTLYSAQLYGQEMENILRSHDQSTPLFMYLAAQDAHAPDQPGKYSSMYSTDKYTKDFIDYNGMISGADDLMRNLTTTLKELDMWDNTLIVFSSDNGGPASKKVSGSAANNYPLRGGKYTAWEGGFRAISFVTGGLVPEVRRGTKLEGYIHVADWYKTFCSLAGVDSHDARAVAAGYPDVDGFDMSPYIIGLNQSVVSPRTEIPLATRFAGHPKDVTPPTNGSAALIVDEFKLVRFAQFYCFWQGVVYPNKTTDHSNEPDCTCGEEGCLFNIISDPGEHIDLKDSLPDVHAKMLARAQQLDLESIEYGRDPNWRGVINETLACEQMVKNGGYWGPYRTE
eukprot:TRINITY_DN19993_c0_g1_i1.p1 TRINITY_DN19993_c0_g1~~TRINITY_DN19993_c0_g1_i1.p1  ORF type:complete len:521 (+),score=89.88 TRINITY_DN19993_c0_g1_i1:50-1612(+)